MIEKYKRGSDGKFHFLYYVKNIITGKCYFGRHTTNKRNDNYFGSGIAIKNAIKKYGSDNFIRRELEFFDNKEELKEAEQKFLNIIFNDLNQNQWFYNISKTADGGYTNNYKNRKLSDEHKKKISIANKGRKREDLLENNILKTFWIGKKRSSQDKIKKSLIAKENIKKGINPFSKNIKCPHCNKFGNIPNMIRWHFENCTERNG